MFNLFIYLIQVENSYKKMDSAFGYIQYDDEKQAEYAVTKADGLNFYNRIL